MNLLFRFIDLHLKINRHSLLVVLDVYFIHVLAIIIFLVKKGLQIDLFYILQIFD